MELQRAIDSLLKWMHRYVSPVFLALLMASFILWYIAKLSYIYTTEQKVRVDVDGQVFDVTCTVEGVGTNLFGYQVYMNKTLRIPLSALKYKRSREEGHEGRIIGRPLRRGDFPRRAARPGLPRGHRLCRPAGAG